MCHIPLKSSMMRYNFLNTRLICVNECDIYGKSPCSTTASFDICSVYLDLSIARDCRPSTSPRVYLLSLVTIAVFASSLLSDPLLLLDFVASSRCLYRF